MIANLAPQNQQAEALLFGLANVMGERYGTSRTARGCRALSKAEPRGS
jgi:hypothetical protein